MYAMSSRHPHHHFHQQNPTTMPTPTPSASPYAVNVASPNLSVASVHVRQQQNRSPSPYAPYLVSHQGCHSQSGTRSRSPIFPTPVSINIPPPSSPTPPPTSAHGHDSVPGPSPTPHPPEDVVMTSTINFTRDHRDRPIINQYLIGHRLGSGQHGEVYKGFDMRRGNMVVAIKACRRKNPKEAKHEQLRQRNQGAIPRTVGGFGGVSARPRLVDQLQSTEKKVLREIAIMKKCKHGQIVQLYEVINDRLTNKILLVMEYMGGGEVKWRDDHGRPCLRVDQTRRICRDVVLGLLYLHHQGIIHRDIKPANLLWTADRKNVKITDFGVSHFSAAQRIDALKHSPAYRDALERRKQVRRKREEEAPGTATPGRRRASGWRGIGSSSSSKEDVKGKGRVRDESYAFSPALLSELSSPGSTAEEDAAAERELLNEIAGDVDPILLDDGGLSRQAGTPSFLAPEIIWEFGEKHTAALYKKVGLKSVARGRGGRSGGEQSEDGQVGQAAKMQNVESSGRDGGDMDRAPASLITTLGPPRRTALLDDETTPRAADGDEHNPLNLSSNFASLHLDETEVTMPDPHPSAFHDPNAIAEGGLDVELDLELPPRPQITKAIDVWALGVTLYCLLFGRTPWGGVTEFAMYQMIHTDDFAIDEFMGYDYVPTGGRFHEDGDTSEGAIVIGLLDRLLEKDCTKRITLEDVKRLPWITRDIPNPEDWLEETSPELRNPIRITSADEDVAMSTVKFRWMLDVKKPFRRFRSLLPAGRSALVRQQQAQRRTEEVSIQDAELHAMIERAMQVDSSAERGGRTPSVARRQVGGSDATGLRRKPSRSRRVVDAVERGVRKMSRQSSSIHHGGETPRSMKRRTLPELMTSRRERSFSRSRDGSRSRPPSCASGPATPRIASGGSCSNLTSPSTAGFTSDGETDILDSDDVRVVRDTRRRERRNWEKEHRHTAFARQSLSNISKILSWRPKASPNASLNESSSKGSLSVSWKGLTRSPASPASPIFGSENGTESGATSARASFATQRLARRSADEFSTHRVGMNASNAARGAPGSIGVRSDSGPAIASAGVATQRRGFALASADELTSAMRASSWGDVADDFGYGFGYSANRRGVYELDADGVSDYGYGSGSAYGDYLYANGAADSYGSGDVDGYANVDEEVRLVGAGGVLSHPVSGPSSPNSLSGVSIGAGLGVPPEGFSLQGVAHEVGATPPASAGSHVVVSGPCTNTLPLLQTQLQDPGRRRGTSVGSRQYYHHPHVISSPLAQKPLNVDRDEPLSDRFRLDDPDEPSSNNGVSTPERSGRSASRDDASSESGVRIVGQGATSIAIDKEVPDIDVFADDDADSSEDEPPPIVVRRRRPSEIIARSQSQVRAERQESVASTSPATPIADVDDGAEICSD